MIPKQLLDLFIYFPNFEIETNSVVIDLPVRNGPVADANQRIE